MCVRCICVCVCVRIHICVCFYRYVCANGRQKLTSGVFFCRFLLVLSLSLNAISLNWEGDWAPWVCLISMPIVKITDVYGHPHLFMWVLGTQTRVPICFTGLLPTEPPPQHGQMLTALESLLLCTHLSKSARNTILGPDGTHSSLHRQLCRNGKPHQRRFWTALSNDSIQTPFLKAQGACDWHLSLGPRKEGSSPRPWSHTKISILKYVLLH